MKKLLIILPTIALIIGAYWLGRAADRKESALTVAGEYPELSSWQILELAIMKTESDFDPLAVGTNQDCGLFQITPIYVQEVNRILDTAYFEHSDAFDIAKSVEMFNVYQDRRNPGHDIAKAIRIHNPGGDSIGYSRKVMENYRYIASVEAARKELIKSDSYGR